MRVLALYTSSAPPRDIIANGTQISSDMACTRGQQAVLTVDPNTGLISSPGDLTQDLSPIAPEYIMEPLFAQLQPQSWVSPTSVYWDGWKFLFERG